jgi:hypothetical protein
MFFKALTIASIGKAYRYLTTVVIVAAKNSLPFSLSLVYM